MTDAEAAAATKAELATAEEEDRVDDSKLKLPGVELAEQDVKTMEEEEEIEFKARAKLFIFVAEEVYGDETRHNFWKERGLGTVKILRHKESGKNRCLMRQEKTLKICLNHIILPQSQIAPNAGSDRSWCFSTLDFAEEELEEHTFAIRFKTSEIAEEFKTAYEKAQTANEELASSAEGGADSGEAAAAGEAADAGEAAEGADKADKADKAEGEAPKEASE